MVATRFETTRILERTTLRRTILILCGVLLLTAATILSSNSIERALVGNTGRSLAWGPMLLRVLLAIHGLGMLLIGVLRGNVTRSASSSVAPASKATATSYRHTVEPFPWIFLLILSAVAVGLRVWRLDSGLWIDEILTATNYTRFPLGYIVSIYDSQNQHMFYSILARLAVVAFGESAWALRLPAVVFGVGSIWALYFFAREVTHKREAFMAAALMAVSYHHIWFSQNARGYTGMLCFTILSSWLLMRGLREGKPALWIWYAVTAALGIWIHLTMLFVVGGHFLIYLWKLLRTKKEAWPQRWQPFFIGFLLLSLFTLELYALVLPQVLGGVLTDSHAEASKVELWKNPLWTAMEVIRSLRIGYAALFGAIAAIVVFLTGVVSYARDKIVVLLFLFIPSMIVGAVAIGTHHPIWPRLFFFTLGFVLLIAVRGACRLGESLAPRPVTGQILSFALPLALIIASVASLPHVYGPKQDFQAALRYVEESRSPGDRVVTIGVATTPYLGYYRMSWDSADTLNQLNALLGQTHRTWVLYTIPLHLQTERTDLKNKVDNDFDLVKSFDGTLAEGTIYVVLSKL